VGGVIGTYVTPIQPGDTSVYTDATASSFSEPTYMKMKEVQIAQAGQYRIKITMEGQVISGATGSYYADIRVNDVTKGTFTTTTTNQVKTVDVTLNANDKVSIWAKSLRTDGAGYYQSNVFNFIVGIATPTVTVTKLL
jgi:hypothetical protein